MKVAIDARTVPGVTGGVAVAVRSLVYGLGQLADGPDEYTVIVRSEEQRAWLVPVPAPNLRVVMPSSQTTPPRGRRLMRALRPCAAYLRRVLDRRLWPEVLLSDGFHESLGCDVLHLPTQNFVMCALPTIYNPHDLQHLRYPQFFSPRLLAWSETVYPAGCHFAQTVVVGSPW